MEKDSKFTRDDEGYVAVRTVVATEATPVAEPDSMFCRDTDGNVAIRVVNGAGSGGDQHNKGFFATEEALVEAYPTAEDGDYAIVGSTDTVWVWDSDTGASGAWVDTDTKGQVTSVNGQTGDVVIADEIPSQTGNAGKFLTTNGTSVSWDNGMNAPLNITASDVGEVFLNLTRSGQTIDFKTYNNIFRITVNSSNHWDITESYIGPATNGMKNLGTQNLRFATVWANFLNNIQIPSSVSGDLAVMNVPTAPTLAVADWSSNTQTVNVTGVTATNTVIISPAPASAADYSAAGILCTAQGAGTLTFTCDTVPSNAITVNVVILG